MGKEENDVERYLDKRVRELGGFTRKWVSPGHKGVQDRICFFPQGEIWFIEVKTTGATLSEHQKREIMRQRTLGHNAGWLAGRNEVDRFIDAPSRTFWMGYKLLSC